MDLATNCTLWTLVNSAFTDEDASRAWAAEEMTWGLFHVPESNVCVLGDVAGLDVIELGCPTAYLSAWLARRSARPVGVDLTRASFTPQPVWRSGSAPRAPWSSARSGRSRAR
jgi:hypothetical protein